MKSFVTALFCILMPFSATALADGVYVTHGENGPVFSDKPQPGAKQLTLRPLTVVEPIPVAKTVAPTIEATQNNKAKTEEAAFEYRKFSVIFPENNGSVVANTAVFEVRVAIDPPLQLGEGHAFSVSLNGRPVGQRFTATEFMIPPEFWGDTLPPANQSMQLDASIVDADGQVLKKATPIRFFMRYATIMNHPRRPPFSRPDDRHKTQPRTDSKLESGSSGMMLKSQQE